VTLLEGRRALVTGASGGVGRAVALALAEAGASVIVTGRDKGRLAQTAGAARRLSPVDVDLTSEGAVSLLADAVGARGLDILVHAAGVIVPGPLITSDPGAIDEQIAVNLRAPVLLTRALLPALRSRRGHVVFVSSTAARRPSGGAAVYAAAKAGLVAFADALREEVNADGVRVSTVLLGRTASAMQEVLHRVEGKPYRPERLIQPGDVAHVVLALVTTPTTAEVTEVALRPAQKP
jgi:NAD(P)-dependent dehydrogenase (short-subunit alcohol dehydrogenase family)